MEVMAVKGRAGKRLNAEGILRSAGLNEEGKSYTVSS